MSLIPPAASLRSFEATARLGSVTLAARELHVTHSAISQQIKVLEDIVGLTLFVREGRGVRVSEEGRLYALQIRQSLGDIAEATRLLQARPKTDELVVAVLPSFARSWLLPRLPAFQRAHPSIRLRLQASLNLVDLYQESIDIGIRIGKGDWQGVEQQLLFSDELVVVAAAQFNGGQLPQGPEQIIESRIIHGSESWLPWCQAAGVEMQAERSDLSCNDSNIVLEAVRLGQGIALERRSLVHDAIARGELVQLSPITAAYAYPHWLVWPPRERSQHMQQAFIQWLGTEVEVYLQEIE